MRSGSKQPTTQVPVLSHLKAVPLLLSWGCAHHHFCCCFGASHLRAPVHIQTQPVGQVLRDIVAALLTATTIYCCSWLCGFVGLTWIVFLCMVWSVAAVIVRLNWSGISKMAHWGFNWFGMSLMVAVGLCYWLESRVRLSFDAFCFSSMWPLQAAHVGFLKSIVVSG